MSMAGHIWIADAVQFRVNVFPDCQALLEVKRRCRERLSPVRP